MKRLAMVTGGAGGIGKAIVQRLAADGFHVVVVDFDEDALVQQAHELVESGFSAEHRCIDLTNEAQVRTMMSALPPLDALVNNAGLFDERSFFDVTADDFRRMYELNLVAAATLTQCAAQTMPGGGKIVNIATRAYLGARNHPHYVASKAALVGYTRASAMELAPRGILVNAVAPGLIETPLLKALTPDRLSAQLALQPTGRAGTTHNVAHAVSFLADPAMDFITGQILFVDGGKSLGGSGA